MEREGGGGRNRRGRNRGGEWGGGLWSSQNDDNH